MTSGLVMASGAGLAAAGVVVAVGLGAQAHAQQTRIPVEVVQHATVESPFGFTFGPPEDSSPPVSLERVQELASGSAAPPGGAASSMDVVHGHVVWEPGGVDRDAWIVTFAGSCTAVLGPAGTDEASRAAAAARPHWVMGTTSRVIDAESGETLLTYSASEPLDAGDASPCAGR